MYGDVNRIDTDQNMAKDEEKERDKEREQIGQKETRWHLDNNEQ